VTVTLALPRFVIAKPLASGRTGFYFNIPNHWRRHGCTIANEPLGDDYARACGVDGNGGRAAVLNALFDEWKAQRAGEPVPGIARFGSVAWLFREYFSSRDSRERVSQRSRPDYERVARLITDLPTKKGDLIGNRPVKSISPRATDKIYEKICQGPRGPRPRQGEKALALCRHAWRVVHRLYPDQFNRDVPNPWQGVTKHRRVKKTKPAATRDQVYKFAWAAIEAGYPEPAAAAVIAFEWLQRPENVLAGCVTWTNYRGQNEPTAIKIEHHKNDTTVWHPLEENTDSSAPLLFYPDAEAVLAKLPRRGVPMILKLRRDGTAEAYRPNHMAKLVRKLADRFGLPCFTLDACRHGGMTELEEAELTTGQGRALSGHKTDRAYGGYAKRTLPRALAATRRRHAYLLAQANTTGTTFQNETRNEFQNEDGSNDQAIA
jgi:integrase